jgi:hypothetical protein
VRLDDWILSLHLLSAFSLVGALTLFTIVVVVLRSATRPTQVSAFDPLMRGGTIAVSIGTIGTLVFGIWLALSVDAYDIWDGWIIAAIVLWAIASELGRRSGVEYKRASERAAELTGAGQDQPDAELAALARTSKGLGLHLASSVGTLAILVLMIWKPGA